MPIPKPRKNETEQEFIPRCISALHHLDVNRPQKQIIAMCYDTWRKSKYSETQIKEIMEYYFGKTFFKTAEIGETSQTLKKSDVKGAIPKWVGMARALLKSKKANKKLKEYWRKRLEAWEAKQK